LSELTHITVAAQDVNSWINLYRQTGDLQAWSKIYDAYKKPIFEACLRLLNDKEDARDICSDVFLKALEHIGTFDENRPFFPWLSRIATNLCIDAIRRKKRIEFEQQHNDPPDERADTPISIIEQKETRRHIQQAIQQLKHEQRRCFCLFYILDKSYTEIVTLTGYSYNEVRSYIQNGRRNFKILMQAMEGQYEEK